MIGFRGVVITFILGMIVGVLLLVAAVAIMASGEADKKEKENGRKRH
jgi:F0F1-type ATP synthase assembly protein I